MIMYEDDYKCCPYCENRSLEVVDCDVALPIHRKKGFMWFEYKCRTCGGISEDINNLESRSERIQARRDRNAKRSTAKSN